MEKSIGVFEKIQEYKSEFCLLLILAMKDVVSEISKAVEANEYVGTYYEWPSISYRKNGMPDMSTSSFNGPKDYSSLFHTLGRPSSINESEIKSFLTFVDFVSSKPLLEGRFIKSQWKKIDDGMMPRVIKHTIFHIITQAATRYIETHDTFVFDSEKAKVIVENIQNYVFSSSLSIDIVIPVLFIKFEFEHYEINDGMEIRRLTDAEQLARYKATSFNVSVHNTVLASATHALVLKDWYVENTECSFDFNILSNIRAYPVDIINKYFGSIRLCTDIETGYAQVFSIGKGWGRHQKAYLPNVEGISTRSYPPILEDYYWNSESIPSISLSKAKEIGSVFINLTNANENSIDLAMKRLNLCMVRDDEEDSVIDATIALEALLSDDSKQEMTHKLAMRAGALSKISLDFEKTPQQVFNDIKSIYSYRSAIVHGSKNLTKKRLIAIDEKNSVTTHSLAVHYLKMLLKIIIDNPKYRDPKTIDNELLLGKL
ncbi:MAG TPA: hypothetical protein DEO86_17785 [Colwellia sp.]|nr:hypothetical protein [Colwellia sp.]|tara:strand:- start:947 stop:2404 length:1458 start_codon:yes stop_codon:yes gene_type:complete